MKIRAFLQNQWFKDPERVRAIYARHPEHRQGLTARFLFMSVTGKRLRAAFGDVIEDIVWENASPEIGGKSSASFRADLKHMVKLIEDEKPDVILAFGKSATEAIDEIDPKILCICGPHPAARQPNTREKLAEMANKLQEQADVK